MCVCVYVCVCERESFILLKIVSAELNFFLWSGGKKEKYENRFLITLTILLTDSFLNIRSPIHSVVYTIWYLVVV